MEKLREEISKIFKKTLVSEELESTQIGRFTPGNRDKNNHKPKKVRFNKGLENEYLVTFSERGFLIGKTRLSFEEIHNALSKRYTITLEDGTILDAVKMQQILKYEDIY